MEEFGEAADFAYCRSRAIGYTSGAALSVLRTRFLAKAAELPGCPNLPEHALGEAHHFAMVIVGCAEA